MACIVLLVILYCVLLSGGYERIGLHEEEDVELAMSNMRTTMQLYAVIVALSFLCLLNDWCSSESSEGEKRPLLGSNVGSPDELKTYND